MVELKPKTKELYLETIPADENYNSIYQIGSRMIELITDKIMYEDLKNTRKINDIIDVIMALEVTDTNLGLVRKLKKSIGYDKNGKIKRHVSFYEIAPSKRLDPPGTLGFDQKEVLQDIIRLGKEDAREQLSGFCNF